MLWINTIQRIGKDNTNTDFIFTNLENITNLSPKRESPYILGQKLMPTPKESEKKGKEKTRENTIKLGEKGIYFICQTGQKTECPNKELPRTLAFNYFYYLKDFENSKKYYQIASEFINSTELDKIMPALILSRAGDNLKSSLLFYQKYESEIDPKNQDYFIKKAIAEYSINLIKNSENKDCKKDITCFQDRLSSEITKQINQCQSNKDNKVCKIIFAGIQKNYIFIDGKLNYPLESGYIYGWREDLQDWRIIKKL